MRQLQGVLNAAERLIVYKLKFDNISSMTICRFNSVSSVHTGVQLSSRRRTRLPVDHVPTSLREYRPTQSKFGCMWIFGCSCHKDGALWSVQFQCGRTVFTELFAGVAARPVINPLFCLYYPNILLPPTQDLSFRQSVCFIITLVTVISLLEWANITVPYKHTCNRYVPSTDRMTGGRMDGRLAKLPWQYRAIGNVAR